MFYPFENCLFFFTMSRYTLKSDSVGGFSLFDEDGQSVSASEWLQSFSPRRVLALHGSMGAGKTTFVKWLCEGLGVQDAVNSPTFAIVNVYDVPCRNLYDNADDATEELYHFDCYRLNSLREALDLGMPDYLDSGRYCLIEWPDVVEPLLPEDAVSVRFTVSADGCRVLEVE